MITNKIGRKYFNILRELAKFDNSILSKLKVTVCEGEIIEEKQCFLVSDKDLENNKSNQKSAGKTTEDSTGQSEVSNEDKSEILDDYIDSSDFSDDS